MLALGRNEIKNQDHQMVVNKRANLSLKKEGEDRQRQTQQNKLFKDVRVDPILDEQEDLNL